MVQKVGSQHFWDREHPLSVRHIRENLVLEQLGENRRSLRATRWTKSPTLARKAYEELGFAVWAPDAGETVVRSILRLLNNGVCLLLKQLFLSAASR
jgi:hypothetical protein